LWDLETGTQKTCIPLSSAGVSVKWHHSDPNKVQQQPVQTQQINKLAVKVVHAFLDLRLVLSPVDWHTCRAELSLTL